MPFRFCPQCGTNLQPGFKFCPSCGEKLPCPADDPGPLDTTLSPSPSLLRKDEAAVSVRTCSAFSTCCEPTETQAYLTTSTVSPRPALRKTRNSLRFDKDVKFNLKDAATPFGDGRTEDISVECQMSSPRKHTVSFKHDAESEPNVKSPSASVVKSPRTVRGKAKLSRLSGTLAEEGKTVTPTTIRKAEESAVDGSPAAPVSSPSSRSPVKGKSKAKKAKHASAVEPLQEGEELTDTTGKKWILMKLLSQSATELIYQVLHKVTRPNPKEPDHILKLGAKDGKIFNEQNFLQRAAKPSSVEKYIKQNKMDFLGIPSCVGFGLHADSYRFLIFPYMGKSLQSVMEDDELLPEKAVVQLACRILDVLEYIHSNEYVHADINTENIYISKGEQSLVYLVGYCHAFRYCPSGQHAEYREASRTAHEGSVEFISLDAHKGAGPSRRSDLQSLGYCMLRWHTGTLPWTALTEPSQVATQKQRFMEDVPALLRHCFGKKRVSSAFQSYLTAVMALEYSEQPDYSELKAGLSAALEQLGGSLEQPLSF